MSYESRYKATKDAYDEATAMLTEAKRLVERAKSQLKYVSSMNIQNQLNNVAHDLQFVQKVVSETDVSKLDLS